VRKILQEARERARGILTGRLDKVRMIVGILLDKEVIEGQELKRLLDG
jgi:ATP-dependent Zn protease